MNTIREVCAAFKAFFIDKTGKPSSVEAYSDKLIYYFLRMYKSTISYEIRTNGSHNNVDFSVEMTLPCVEMEKVNAIEAPFAPPSSHYFMKTKHPLPNMVNGLPNSVSAIFKELDAPNYGSFTYVDWYNFEDKVGSRVKAQSKQPYFTIKNINGKSNIYIYGNAELFKDIKGIAVAANYNDILEVVAYPGCGMEQEELCQPMDEIFLIEDELKTKLFERTFKALQAFKSTAPGTDEYNNDKDDTTQQIKNSRK